MSTEELSRIEKQIAKLAGRVNEQAEQTRINSRRIDDLLEQNRLLAQRLDKAEKGFVAYPPVFVDPSVYVWPSPPTTAGAESDPRTFFAHELVPQDARTFVYDHKGICVSESHKVPGATPFGKES